MTFLAYVCFTLERLRAESARLDQSDLATGLEADPLGKPMLPAGEPAGRAPRPPTLPRSILHPSLPRLPALPRWLHL